ncbi:hypothetical protein [Blastococcus sp. TF02A-30]|uniref:hypothetical protein n=1 Tax=Blastococcus sp. TF02A-30 TaxID=2250580 RepID=UPI000DE8AE29|nr:hypothetical protein [Blastococcus sp. TF02A-30]RBY89423.1 hypothetical protein DQ241_08145 [Blastococcus sp. TF02A-30]
MHEPSPGKEVNSLSPSGQLQGLSDLMGGLVTNRRGRRRGLRMLAALLMVIAVGLLLMAVFG